MASGLSFLPGQRRYRATLPSHEIETIDLASLLSGGTYAAPRTSAPAPLQAAVAPQAPKRSRTREFSTVVTPSMREVLRIVTRIANLGDPMPNNPVLGEICGGRGRSSALRALRRLAFVGLVSIERVGSRRRVIITATKQATDWGNARPGHSPYIHHRPGEPRTERPPVARRPESRPLPVRLPALPAPSQRALVAAHAPADSCQMPTWADGDRPGSGENFCGVPSAPGSSFCAKHHALCFLQRPASRPLRYVDGPAHLDKRRFNTTPAGTKPVKVVDVSELFDKLD